MEFGIPYLMMCRTLSIGLSLFISTVFFCLIYPALNLFEHKQTNELPLFICVLNLKGIYFLNMLLTLRLSINLVNDQLEAQLFYFIIRLLQSSTCFELRNAHHQEVKFY